MATRFMRKVFVIDRPLTMAQQDELVNKYGAKVYAVTNGQSTKEVLNHAANSVLVEFLKESQEAITLSHPKDLVEVKRILASCGITVFTVEGHTILFPKDLYPSELIVKAMGLLSN